jgi:hypothetical protein
MYTKVSRFLQGCWTREVRNIVYIIPPDIRVIGLSFSKLEAYFIVATFSDRKSIVSSISEIGTT